MSDRGVHSFWQWRVVDGTARIPSRRGQRGGRGPAEGEGEEKGRGNGGPRQPNAGLIRMFVDGPSTRYNPPSPSPSIVMVRRRGSSAEALIVGIKWLLVFV